MRWNEHRSLIRNDDSLIIPLFQPSTASVISSPKAGGEITAAVLGWNNECTGYRTCRLTAGDKFTAHDFDRHLSSRSRSRSRSMDRLLNDGPL